MSGKGIYTALSGAMAQNLRLDTIANNIANVNTNGFKKDKQVFYEYLTSAEKLPDVMQVPRVPASIESFYDMQGGDRGYVDSSGTYTDFTQGMLQGTGNVLDVALEGEGFLEVLTPNGVRMTRAGALKVDGEGRLVTKDGHPVLRSGLGQEATGRTMQVNTQDVTISHNGDVYAQGQFVGKLGMVKSNTPQAFQKEGANLYALKSGVQADVVEAADVQVHQGFLERSNINIVDEMTDMIAASRVFESTQKAIQAFDQMNGKLVNDVPKT